MLRFLALTAVLATVLGTELAAAERLPFEGKWSRRIERCNEAGGLLTITADRLVTPVMSCEFRSVLPGGASFRVEAACEALGQKADEFFTFSVLSERLYWSWAERTGTFERCPN